MAKTRHVDVNCKWFGWPCPSPCKLQFLWLLSLVDLLTDTFLSEHFMICQLSGDSIVPLVCLSQLHVMLSQMYSD